MALLTLNILWTKEGDEIPCRRLRELIVNVPAISFRHTHLTAAELNALLDLPMREVDGEIKDTTYTVRLVDERYVEICEHEVLNHAVPAALKQIERTKRMQAARAKEAARVKTERSMEINEWAEKHGSARLKEQLNQGLSGWPLYLHERLEADYPGAELDNDGETGATVVNPTETQLRKAREVAERIVKKGRVLSTQEAFAMIRIVTVRFQDSIPYDTVFVMLDGYRPGSDVFEAKTIRFNCDGGD